MASGKKNYFRHSVNARKDEKIMQLIDNGSKEDYFHFFVILELCAQQAENCFPENGEFFFHARTLAQELMVNRSKLVLHLSKMQSCSLLEYTMTENKVQLLVPNLAKYMGRYETKYDPNSPNKRKENKIKENKRKEKESETTSDPNFFISNKIMQTLKMVYQYPEEIINEVAKDAWLIYLGDPNPEKNWERFLTHYFKNEKEKIREKLIKPKQKTWQELAGVENED